MTDAALDDDMLAAIAAAEAAVAMMADGYPELLLQDLAALNTALDMLGSAPVGSDAHAAACGDAFGILHDIKGQAASFGYTAATALCDPLCDALRGVRTVDAPIVTLLRAAGALMQRMAEEGPSPVFDHDVALLVGRANLPG